MGIDIETTRKIPDRKEKKGEVHRGGLDPYLSRVVMLQIGNFEKIFVIDMREYSNEQLKDIIEFIMVGASAVQIGTVNFTHPDIAPILIKGLEDYCIQENINNIMDIRGII